MPFTKGKSGNARGRPRGGISEAKRKMLQEMPAGLYALSWKTIETSVKLGNAETARWVIEMKDGKPRQKTEVTGKDGAVLELVKVVIVNGD